MSATRMTLDALENQDEFISRHNGPSAEGQQEMLAALEVGSLDQLIEQAVPEVIRAQAKLDLPGAITEAQLLAEAQRLAGKNQVMTSLIGLGYHDCIVPPVIQRNVLENPGWYTAYTPYQAEIAQGRLEALVNFQQMIMDMTGMELASASLLDEGTAAAEAMTLMLRVGKAKSNKLFVAADCYPQTLAVIQTRAAALGIEVQVGDPESDLNPDEVFGVILQYGSSNGEVRDYRALVTRIHQTKALVTVACDLLSLALLTPPGEWGADVVIGSSQRFGVPLGYGGPHAAFMAFREAYKRTVPGRIIGVSIDRHGNPAYRLALQTQHLHRPGFAGGDGRFLRHLARSGRDQAHRRAGASADGDPGGGAKAPGRHGGNRKLFRQPGGQDRRSGPGAGAGGRHQPARSGGWPRRPVAE